MQFELKSLELDWSMPKISPLIVMVRDTSFSLEAFSFFLVVASFLSLLLPRRRKLNNKFTEGFFALLKGKGVWSKGVLDFFNKKVGT